MALVNAREQAKSEREGRTVKAVDEEDADDIQWEPAKSPTASKKLQPAEVPSLFASCLAVLNEYVDCIDSLLGVPDAIKVRFATYVCNQRKLCPKVACLFAEGAPTEVVLPDCHQLDAAAMTELVQACATSRLEILELGSCGRGFGDLQADLLSKSGPYQSMSSMTLGGAYRLSDTGLVTILRATPALTTLALPHASRLTGSAIEQLPSLVPRLAHMSLANCRGVGMEELKAALPKLPKLQSLNLDGMQLVDDEVLAAAAAAPGLQDLSICYTQVTDAGLAALVLACPGLQGLRLDECMRVTDAGLKAVTEGCHDLRVLSTRRCHRLTDEGIARVAMKGTLRKLVVGGVPLLGNKTMKALALHCKESLEYLDVSFCRGFSQRALGLVADRCHRLSHLVLFSCSQVGQLFLQGHSNSNLVNIVGLGTMVDR